MQIEHNPKEGKWTAQVDDGPIMEFRDRVYMLIYLNNATASMVGVEEE